VNQEFGIDGRPVQYNTPDAIDDILENIPTMATSAEQYIEYFKSLIKENVPFEYGVDKMYGESGWRKVYFSKPFAAPPVVFLQGTAKSGWIEDIKIDLPTTEIKSIEIPTIKLDPLVLPEIQIPRIDTKILRLQLTDLLPNGYDSMASWFYDLQGKHFDDEVPPGWYAMPAIGPTLWAIKIITQYLAAFIGERIQWFADEYIQPLLDRIEDTLKKIADSINKIIGTKELSGTINGELSRTVELLNNLIASIQEQIESNYNFLVESINTNLEFAVGGLNATMKTVELRLEEAINGSIKRLYELLQIGEEMPIVPTMVRNVTTTSFEYYSTGGDYYWIAFGTREMD